MIGFLADGRAGGTALGLLDTSMGTLVGHEKRRFSAFLILVSTGDTICLFLMGLPWVSKRSVTIFRLPAPARFSVTLYAANVIGVFVLDHGNGRIAVFMKLRQLRARGL